MFREEGGLSFCPICPVRQEAGSVGVPGGLARVPAIPLLKALDVSEGSMQEMRGSSVCMVL